VKSVLALSVMMDWAHPEALHALGGPPAWLLMERSTAPASGGSRLRCHRCLGGVPSEENMNDCTGECLATARSTPSRNGRRSSFRMMRYYSHFRSFIRCTGNRLSLNCRPPPSVGVPRKNPAEQRKPSRRRRRRDGPAWSRAPGAQAGTGHRVEFAALPNRRRAPSPASHGGEIMLGVNPCRPALLAVLARVNAACPPRLGQQRGSRVSTGGSVRVASAPRWRPGSRPTGPHRLKDAMGLPN
jgi:hypothetical protein